MQVRSPEIVSGRKISELRSKVCRSIAVCIFAVMGIDHTMLNR